MTDKRIEIYLRKSTRGLWGRKKAEVREELSAHIGGRVHDHLVAGHSERDALEKTLIELGHPTHVSVGMARLHTLPLVAGSGMALAMCCALVVVLLSGSTAQTLAATEIFPSDECLELQTTLPGYCYIGGWVSIDKLKEALEPQGVKFKTVGQNWVLDFPSNEPVVLPESGSQQWFFELEDKSTKQMSPNPDYFRISDVIAAFQLTQLPLSLEGWEKPVLRVGDITLEIELLSPDSRASYGSQEFYFEPIGWDIFNSIGVKTTYRTIATPRESTTETKRFKVSGEEGTVYGLVLLMDPKKALSVTENVNDTSVIFSDVAQADANGEVAFRLPFNQSLTFQSSAPQMKAFGDALLVRLSGDLTNTKGYVVIPPDQIQME
jgi:hypothetical protein